MATVKVKLLKLQQVNKAMHCTACLQSGVILNFNVVHLISMDASCVGFVARHISNYVKFMLCILVGKYIV